MNVMLVDDSRVMRSLVRRCLRQAGYKLGEVWEAEHGVDAMEQLKHRRPHLVLSDWNMPTMGGLELLQSLRGEGDRIPLGFVTSESTPEMRAAAISSGAMFLLTKPFTATDMRHSMEAAGFRPTGRLRERSNQFEARNTTFGPALVAELVGHLVNQRVVARKGPALPATVRPALSAAWEDDAGRFVYGAVCELQLAAALGAALGLRPPSAVRDLIAAGSVEQGLRADCYEVFNVMSRTFTDAGSIHVKLSEVAFAPDPMLADVVGLRRRPPGRSDMKLTIGQHGAGRMTFYSIDSGFLITH